MRTLDAQPLLDACCTLGEGPVWAHGRLAFVDIERKTAALAQTDGVNAEIVCTAKFDGRVGAILPRSNTGWLAAVEGVGLLLLDERLRNPELLCHPDVGRTNNRYNDGAVDPQGRLWIGSMRLGGDDPAGALYRVDPDGTHALVLDHLLVSNGLAWSPDAKTLYFTDTGNRRIDAYDFDGADGTITNRRTFMTIEGSFPDGHCTDAEGGLWVAHWAGGRVTRFDPDGTPTHEVRVPVSNATSCCFAGEDLRTLVITTAHERDMPHAGALFCVRTGHVGMEAPLFLG